VEDHGRTWDIIRCVTLRQRLWYYTRSGGRSERNRICKFDLQKLLRLYVCVIIIIIYCGQYKSVVLAVARTYRVSCAGLFFLYNQNNLKKKVTTKNKKQKKNHTICVGIILYYELWLYLVKILLRSRTTAKYNTRV